MSGDPVLVEVGMLDVVACACTADVGQVVLLHPLGLGEAVGVD